jgi:osmotically-inducible protein OsmY
MTEATMSDRGLKQDILDELEFEPRIDASKIGVAVEDGIVTLTGHVGSYAEKVAAERAVRRVTGVRGIAEEIEVRPNLADGVHDDEIARRIADMLRWSTLVPDGTTLVEVEHGRVTLTGRVDWAYQKRGALDVVEGMRGVTGVVDHIELSSRLAPKCVKSAIEGALRRNAEFDGHAVRVGVEGNTVTLEGRVRTWRHRHLAEEAAWSVAGVNEVTNRLQVG